MEVYFGATLVRGIELQVLVTIRKTQVCKVFVHLFTVLLEIKSLLCPWWFRSYYVNQVGLEFIAIFWALKHWAKEGTTSLSMRTGVWQGLEEVILNDLGKKMTADINLVMKSKERVVLVTNHQERWQFP